MVTGCTGLGSVLMMFDLRILDIFAVSMCPCNTFALVKTIGHAVIRSRSDRAADLLCSDCPIRIVSGLERYVDLINAKFKVMNECFARIGLRGTTRK